MGMFQDSLTLLRRYLTKLIRNPLLFGTNLVTPLVFLFLFSQLLGKLSVFPGVTGNYLTYLTPGVLVLNAMIQAPQSGVSMANDLNSGFLSKVLVTRASRPAILIGRLMTDVVVVMLACFLVLAAAAADGVTFATGTWGILLLLATVAIFELAFAGLFLWIGIRTRQTETISAVSGGLFFILVFISSAMFPTSFFPPWARTVSTYNPVSYASNVVRGLVQGGLTWGTVISAYSVIGAIFLVTFAATWYQFRQVVR